MRASPISCWNRSASSASWNWRPKSSAACCPAQDDDLPICGINRPIREVSGDFYDYFELPDGTIAFALGDVSGKGMNAALLMAKTASLFRCLGKTIRDPARLLSILNREICETTSRGMFVTMVAGLYEPSDRAAALCQCRPPAAAASSFPTISMKP